jgi:thymidylate synthase ThyX
VFADMADDAIRKQLLERYFSQPEARPHADVFLVRNLPAEVAATLNGVYSRSPKSMRDNFVERLEKGLEKVGKSLADLELGPVATDQLSAVLADRSGEFLKTYAIDHGHNSLREGSVVHLAVENVSQLVTRFCQRERRCSFEESSTRYISFSAESHWRDPDVVAAGGEALAAYERILSITFDLYQQLGPQLLEHLKRKFPMRTDQKEGAWLRALKAEAFDSARYLLTPAIQTKWGMVCDARTLSDMITELVSHPLAEFRLVGERLLEEGRHVLPTLLAHARSNAYLQDQWQVLPQLASRVERAAGTARGHAAAEPSCRLLAHDPQLDARLLASLLYEHSHASFEELLAGLERIGEDERTALANRALEKRGARDPWPAGLEGSLPFDFELLVDFGAYRDIGRHRKGFQQQQTLTCDHGYLVPPLVEEAGHTARYRAVMDEVVELRERVAAAGFEHAAGYVTPFAFLQRVRLVFEPRQVAYFIELRSGEEGHFAYRQAALDMLREVRRVSPLFARFIRANEKPTVLGRMHAEQTADDRRKDRMRRAGDLAAE